MKRRFVGNPCSDYENFGGGTCILGRAVPSVRSPVRAPLYAYMSAHCVQSFNLFWRDPGGAWPTQERPFSPCNLPPAIFTQIVSHQIPIYPSLGVRVSLAEIPTPSTFHGILFMLYFGAEKWLVRRALWYSLNPPVLVSRTPYRVHSHAPSIRSRRGL